MAALTASKNILEKYDPRAIRHDHVGADSTQFFKGGLVCFSAGRLKKAAAADVGQVVGVCEDEVLTGVSNTRRIGSASGIFPFVASGSITAADTGKVAFVVDDQTVDITTAASLVAGVVYDVDAAGLVWVAVNYPGFVPQIAGTGAGSQFSQ